MNLNKHMLPFVELMKNNNDAYGNAINEAKKLMYSQTTKNGAPSWLLTTLAVNAGKELALEYNVDKNIVVLTLYLQHLIMVFHQRYLMLQRP